jgi:cephalosporin-C deacetylase-like acetyl esterase
MRPTLLLASLLVVTPPALVVAQAPDTVAVRLVVSLDHADWLYRVGDTARYQISLLRNGRAVPNVRARVAFGEVRMKTTHTDTVDVGQGAQTLRGALPYPGFLRATATAVVDGATYTAMATAGFSPERVRATTTMPADFQQYWAAAIADARRTPLAPQMTRMPQYSTADVDVYHINFQNQSATSRIYGMLSVPTKPGKYPATLVVPGAGVRPYFPSVATAKRGVIHLAIGVHGIPVDRDSLLYNELRATALNRYWAYGVEDKELYYYKRVFVAVIRAGDFIYNLPQFDGTNYVVQGGSQGGALALFAGALDPRVKAIAVTHPAMSDHFAYFAGKPGGWPHIFQDTSHMRALPEKMETMRYYDAVNFARLVKIPGIYTWGFNDNTVPPTSSYAAYNEISAPKELFLAPETGHFRLPWQTERIDAWILNRLGVGK